MYLFICTLNRCVFFTRLPGKWVQGSGIRPACRQAGIHNPKSIYYIYPKFKCKGEGIERVLQA